MTDDIKPLPPDLRAILEEAIGDAYAFERELGGGGMSRVFVAQDRALGRQVVVKVLKEDTAAGVSFDRFRREIQLAAKLQHPHIVPLLSSGEVAGMPYFTMPFIEGESLRARLAREGELPVNEAVRILRHVAAALSYAHKHGVVHRDIKPDNVMLTEDFALVTDFGVAKAVSESSQGDATSSSLTGHGLALGTPAYMSPEQAVADPTVDHRADVYSWGIMAYEMLTGWPPFSGKSPQATLAAQAVEAPDPIQRKRPGLPPALADLVMRCLQKRPADRPQNVAEILHDLNAIATPTGGTLATGAVASILGAGATAAMDAATPKPRNALFAVGGVLVVALLAAVAYGLKNRTEKPASASSSGELSSIAVLPLDNVGGDTATEYFSEGMTDELANALGKLPGLRVASRTSAYAYKGRKDASVADIGEKLHVQALLVGSVRRAGDRLRVTAQLTNVSDGLALWSEQYEREVKDVFQVQDDIARSIADALKLKLGARAAQVSSTSRGTDNLRAYDLYLRGEFFWYRRGADNLRKAISYFDQAVAIDPNFGNAYAALAISYALLPEYTDSPPADVLERTRIAANKALAIDSGLAQAHAALGLASVHAWEWDNAEKEYKQAIALEPRYPTGHQWYGELLYHIGRIDSAIVEIRTATELDPLAPITTSALGYALFLAGRCDESIAQAKRGLELAPTLAWNHELLANCYVAKRDYAGGGREMETAVRNSPELTIKLGILAHIYGVGGEKQKAQEVLSKLRELSRTEHIHPYSLAVAELGVGNDDAALTELEKAVVERDVGLTQYPILVEPMWKPFSSNSRFRRILEQMHLAKYPPKQ